MIGRYIAIGLLVMGVLLFLYVIYRLIDKFGEEPEIPVPID